MDNETYKTTDLGKAATLETLGFRFDGLENTENPGQKMFVFSNIQLPPQWFCGEHLSAEEVADQYVEGTVLVDAQELFLSIKKLKSRLYRSKD